MVVVVAAIRLARGEPLADVLLGAVSLAVAAIPEGLGAIVTIALAIGVQRMVTRHVLIRKLPAIETLGCATVVCTDKTGTLTTGEMVARELVGPSPERLLDAAAACCNADLDGKTGDTTELAILAAARQRGIERSEIERARPRRAEIPFDSVRKRMSVLRADGILYVKGAVDVLLPLCTSGTEEALVANEALASRGIRVLAVARGQGPEERDLTLVGLIGFADPPRPEAIQAVKEARRAGLRTVMITGDHPATARAIARELGILEATDAPGELVHARATPEDKLKIVRGWKERGEIVAMTGDGVNDAPALREAHIGVAMGRTGTEVAREAAAMILTDPTEKDVLDRPPRPLAEPIVDARRWLRIALTGLLEATLVLAFFAWVLRRHTIAEARSVVFSLLVFSEIFRAFAARSERGTFWQLGAFTNLRLLAVVMMTIGFQVAMPFVPSARALFDLVPLAREQILLLLLAGLIPVSLLELTKLMVRLRN